MGWVTLGGDVAVGSFDHASKDVESFVLRSDLQVDDHVSPALGGGRRATIHVRLTRPGLTRVKRARRLHVRVVATSSSLSGRGAPVRGKVGLVLRRRR